MLRIIPSLSNCGLSFLHIVPGEELAQSLNEPKTDLMVGVVDVVGVEMALELFKVSSTDKSSSPMKKAYLALVPRHTPLF